VILQLANDLREDSPAHCHFIGDLMEQIERAAGHKAVIEPGLILVGLLPVSSPEQRMAVSHPEAKDGRSFSR
jgi:hypothetical protein